MPEKSAYKTNDSIFKAQPYSFFYEKNKKEIYRSCLDHLSKYDNYQHSLLYVDDIVSEVVVQIIQMKDYNISERKIDAICSNYVKKWNKQYNVLDSSKSKKISKFIDWVFVKKADGKIKLLTQSEYTIVYKKLSQLDNEQKEKLFSQAINEIKDTYTFAVIYLYYVESLDCKQIGQRTKLPITSILEYLRKGKEHIENYLINNII